MTMPILYEYIEVLQIKAKPGIAQYLESSFLSAKNVLIPETYYSWNLISVDPDDNKFFDAAVASNADYLVTNDNHFNEVKDIDSPKVNIISADDFLEIIKLLG